ncbi:hypothetical protein [Priestia aryabhattai]
MITLKEKEKLQTLLRYLEHQELADQYHEQLYSPNTNMFPKLKRNSRLDVSHRDRDSQGRFLPYNFQTVEESNMILEEEIELPRKLTVKPIANSYNSYSVDEKTKRDWSGNIYLGCIAAILTIAYFT